MSSFLSRIGLVAPKAALEPPADDLDWLLSSKIMNPADEVRTADLTAPSDPPAPCDDVSVPIGDEDDSVGKTDNVAKIAVSDPETVEDDPDDVTDDILNNLVNDLIGSDGLAAPAPVSVSAPAPVPVPTPMPAPAPAPVPAPAPSAFVPMLGQVMAMQMHAQARVPAPTAALLPGGAPPVNRSNPYACLSMPAYVGAAPASATGVALPTLPGQSGIVGSPNGPGNPYARLTLPAFVGAPPNQETMIERAARPNGNFYAISCPHCGLQIVVPWDGVNCGVFRHGVYKNAPTEQLPPHLPEAECARLISEGAVIGCGRPFRFDGLTASVCDYI